MESSRYFHSRSLVSRLLFFIFLVFFMSSSVRAELLLSAPPRESADVDQALYGPLADQLSQTLGEKVTYVHPKSWMFYQRDIRADKYDIVFDAAHFVSWRIKQYQHTPVAKLPGKLRYIIVADKDNLAINSAKDLVNIPVCSIAPPDISTLTVLAHMADPVRTPRLISVDTGMKGVYQAFSDRKCEAAILRQQFFTEQVPEEERTALKTIYQSEPVTNQGITVSRRISSEQRTLIAEALTKTSNATRPALQLFAPEAEKMRAATLDEYANHHKLLSDVVFGWEITAPDTVAAQTVR